MERMETKPASRIERWDSWDGATSTFTVRLRRRDYEALPSDDAKRLARALRDIEDVFARSATEGADDA